tara:strand:+ start:1434 stop:3140 length:1707 start_codon:yes stop_codon:yes gene_type:complete
MIQIIDGFNLPTETPIDSRIVVADATKRLGISSKYHGLRVWEQDTDTPYYWDGNTWVSELDLVVTGVDGNVTDGKIPKFTSINPTKIEDSKISDDGSTVTIDGILDVTGDLIFGGTLDGDIDAVNITTGFLNLDRLDVGSGGVDDVLQIDSLGVPKFVSLSGISIGSSSTSNQVKLTNVTNTSYYKFTLREDNNTVLGNSFDLYSYTTDLLLSQNSTSMCILAHGGSKENPPYSFYNTISASKEILGGMYYNVDKLVFSKQNSSGTLVNSLVIDNDAVTFGESANFSPRIRTHQDPTNSAEPSYTWWGNDTTGMYRPDDNVIGFSIDGDVQMKIESDGVHIKTSQYDNPDANDSPIVFNNINSIGVPIGGIIIWSGDPDDIGSGNLWNFRECDGTSTPSTVSNNGVAVNVVWSGSSLPDLEGRFALGSDGNTYESGVTDGSSTTPIGDSNLPRHKHEVNLRTGALATPGTGFTAAEVLNNPEQRTNDGEHTHRLKMDDGTSSNNKAEFPSFGSENGSGYGNSDQSVGSYPSDHNHEVRGMTDATGVSSPDDLEIMPPYLVVTYIIRLV